MQKIGGDGGGLGAVLRRRWRSIALALLALALVFAAGVLAGHRLNGSGLSDRIDRWMRGAASGAWSGTDTLTLRWQSLPTPGGSNLHRFEYVKFPLVPFRTFGRGGAIEQLGSAIVFASPTGELGYLSGANRLKTLFVSVAMNLDALESSAIGKDSRFYMWDFRVLDLLAVPTGTDRWDLYVSHARFDDGCFALVVSRIALAMPEPGEIAATGGWQHVFTATPCIGPYQPAKKAGEMWQGSSTGGRMVLLDDRTILLATGDEGVDDVDRPGFVAQDPESTLGKLVAIDIATGRAAIYASGVRNPQGLLVARDGTVWETEHGPQGGDEINIVRKGANYGWPRVTYGTQYGSGRRVDWPANPVQGRHDGYDAPAFAFVPSIGISNLIQPDMREFPLWKDHLMVGSMRAMSLFLVKVEDGNRPVYAEQIHVDALGRIRDLLSLSDGRIAVLNDEGELALLRNEETPAGSVVPRDRDLTVTISDSLAGQTQTRSGRSPVEEGRLVFARSCATCHGVDGESRIAPHLDGVMDRQVGSVPGFAYSPALKGHGGRWNPELLGQFLADPQAQFAGSRMPPVALDPSERDAVVAFLAAQ